MKQSRKHVREGGGPLKNTLFVVALLVSVHIVRLKTIR